MADDIATVLERWAERRNLLRKLSKLLAQSMGQRSFVDVYDALVTAQKRISELYDALEDMEKRIAELEADTKLGELVRGMPDGIRLEKDRETYWVYQYQGRGRWYCVNGSKPTTDPARALRAVQEEGVIP